MQNENNMQIVSAFRQAYSYLDVTDENIILAYKECWKSVFAEDIVLWLMADYIVANDLEECIVL